MPLLSLPVKLLRGAEISRADVFDAPIERVIAEGRIILAALTLFAVAFSPELRPPRSTEAFQVLIAYAGFAVALIAIWIWRFPRRPAGYAVHAIDICFQFALDALTEGRANPVLAFFTFFVLMAASLRWDWQAVMVTALVLAGAPVGISILHTVASGANTDLQVAVVGGVYVIMTGAMLAYYSAVRERRREQLTKLTDWPGPDPSQIDRPNLTSLLAHCARALEAPRVLVLWEESEEPFVNIVLWQDGKYQHTREMAGIYGNFVRAQQHAETVFWTHDAGSTFATMLEGPSRVQSPILDEALVKAFAIRGVASAPFIGGSCRGRLLLLDRDNWSDFQLRLI